MSRRLVSIRDSPTGGKLLGPPTSGRGRNWLLSGINPGFAPKLFTYLYLATSAWPSLIIRNPSNHDQPTTIKRSE